LTRLVELDKIRYGDLCHKIRYVLSLFRVDSASDTTQSA
jgi:hypothetical protein